MPAFTTLALAAVAVAGVATAGVGMYESNKAAKENQQAQEQIIAGQQAEFAAQQQQMELDAMRRKREIVRQSLAARAQANATATSQGAAQGSALAGAYGGISGVTGTNYLGANQNLELGREVGAAKQTEFGGYYEAAQAQTLAAYGAGLTSLGGSILHNLGAIGKVGEFGANFLGSFGGGGGSVGKGGM